MAQPLAPSPTGGLFFDVRTLIAAALVLAVAACGRADRADVPASHGATSGIAYRGPDPLILRIPRKGGTPRVYAYPNVDSLVWTASEGAPAPQRILGFDETAGAITFDDSRGRPGWLDLRLGAVTIASRNRLNAPVGVDGPAVFGITAKHAVVRYTPDGTWTLVTPAPASAVFPQGDGSVLILGGKGDKAAAWRARPPETELSDTVSLPSLGRPVRTQLGDRLYLLGDKQLLGIDTRRFTLLDPVPLDHRVNALVATPSGDRLFAAYDESPEVGIFDRYRGGFVGNITLPAPAIELRMDPVGRYLLARAEHGDSAWVVALGTGQVIGAVHTEWRVDLPFVAPDGGVALAQGKNVVFVDGATLHEMKRVAGGTSDYWYPFMWDGFRPRAAVLDQSAPLANPDSMPADTTTPADTTAAPVDSQAAPVAPPPTTAPAATQGFTVSFAALLSQDAAKQKAGQIRVEGRTARVVSAARENATIYRVVLGPYPTREEAERVGRASGQSFWVYEGNP